MMVQAKVPPWTGTEAPLPVEPEVTRLGTAVIVASGAGTMVAVTTALAADWVPAALVATMLKVILPLAPGVKVTQEAPVAVTTEAGVTVQVKVIPAWGLATEAV